MRPVYKAIEILGAVLFFTAWLNFAVFWLVAVLIGGDAISGNVQGNHYYVSSHGKLTEVSPRSMELQPNPYQEHLVHTPNRYFRWRGAYSPRSVETA